jgi:hypothetical protein
LERETSFVEANETESGFEAAPKRIQHGGVILNEGGSGGAKLQGGRREGVANNSEAKKNVVEFIDGDEGVWQTAAAADIYDAARSGPAAWSVVAARLVQQLEDKGDESYWQKSKNISAMAAAVSAAVVEARR